MLALLLACTSASPDADSRPHGGDHPRDTGDDTGDPLPAGTLGNLAEDGAPVLLDTWPTVNYRGVDAAWSAHQDAFLVAWGNAPIGGALLDDSGAQVGAPFRLTEAEYDGSNWTQNPRVVADDDGFLVSWHAETTAGVVPQVRKVIAGPAFVGPAEALDTVGSQQESAIALAWSPDTGEHVAVWAQDGLRLRRLDGSGHPLAAPAPLTEPGTWTEQPAIVHEPDCACFFVTTMQEYAGAARVLLLRVADGSGDLLDDPVDLTGPLDFAKVTDLARDAAREQVVATWYEVRGGVAGFAAQAFAPDGTPLGEARTVFSPYGSYDGYDLAWSPVTGTSLGVFHGFTAATVVAELGADLQDGDPFVLDAAGATNGVFLPRAVAHPDEPLWFVFGSPDYAAVSLQRVRWSP